jgi:hypothetical protein
MTDDNLPPEIKQGLQGFLAIQRDIHHIGNFVIERLPLDSYLKMLEVMERQATIETPEILQLGSIELKEIKAIAERLRDFRDIYKAAVLRKAEQKNRPQ